MPTQNLAEPGVQYFNIIYLHFTQQCYGGLYNNICL